MATATATAKNYFYGLGRRKSATARVRLSSGKGEIKINDKTAEDFFDGSKYLLAKLQTPFQALSQENKFSISARVVGGGHSAQADAIRLGIAKALVEMNGDFKSTLRRADLLTGDAREKERKKFGLRKARKQRQFTKR